MRHALRTLLIATTALTGCPGEDRTVHKDADTAVDADGDDGDTPDGEDGDTTDGDADAEEDTTRLPPAGTCEDPLLIGCEMTVTTSSVGRAAAFPGYPGCAPGWDEGGPEVVIAFSPPEAGEVTLTLDADADLDVFALGGACAAESCAAAGDHALTVYADAGSAWFLVVDGYGDAAGTFTLGVDCDAADERLCDDGHDGDGDGATDCDDPDCGDAPPCLPVTSCDTDGTITCGQVLRATTAGLAADVDRWSCAPGWGAGGGEHVRTFTPAADGTVTVELRASDPVEDLDVYVLDDVCASDRCLTFGDTSASFPVTAGETYHLIVDAATGVASDFALGVSCDGLALELGCADGVDDDGDGLTDCADPDCGDDLAACPGPIPCASVEDTPLTCDTVERLVDTTGGVDGVIAWPCAAGDTSGPELALPVSVDAAREVTVWLDGEADLALLVARERCEDQACTDFGDTSVRFVAVPGEDVFVVVDGLNGAGGPATLTVACDDPVERACGDGVDEDRDGETDCDDADCAAALGCLPSASCTPGAPLSCGDTLTGDTTTGLAAVPVWSCDGWDERGPEVAYTFTSATATGVRLALDPPEADLDLVLATACDAASCLVTGDTAVTFVAEAGAEYVVVVDGYAGAAGPYTLSAACAAVDDEVCDSGVDEDFDGLTDCEDPACAGEDDCAVCAEDDWEPDDDASSGAAALTPGHVARRTLCPWGDEDWFRFALDHAEDFAVVATGGVTLGLYDSYGLLIATTDDGRFDVGSAPASTYRVKVSGEAALDYDLRLTLDRSCPVATPVACGSAPRSATLTGASKIDHYAGHDGLLPGPERAYAVTPSETGEVTFALLAAAPETRVLAAVGSCGSVACASGAADRVSVPVTAGETVYAVVDGPLTSAFTLAILCPGGGEQACDDGLDDDLDGATDCDDLDCLGMVGCVPSGVCSGQAAVIGCGDVVTGATLGGPRDLVGYDCAPTFATGPEAVHVFTAPAAHRLTATLDAPGGAGLLGLYALAGSCRADACVGRASSGGALTLDVAAGETLYLVVDGLAGAFGDYTLSLACAPPREHACDDGVDDEPDGATDCEDPDCAGDLACGGVTCAPAATLTCDTIIWGETGDGAAAQTDYAGVPYPFAGPELVYALPLAEDTEVTLTLTDLEDAGLPLMVLGGDCGTASCALWAPSQARFVAAAGAEIYVVVDGLDAAGELLLRTACEPALYEDCDNGVDDDGDANTDCDDPDCFLAAACVEHGCGDGFDDDGDGLTDCEDADCDDVCLSNTCAALGSVGCGQTVTGTTVGAANAISHYPACTAVNEAGPEVAWSFAAATDVTVTATLELLDAVANLDLFVLDGACAAASCAVSGTDYAGEALTFEVDAGETSYLVVDGPWGGAADYRLTLTCEEGQ